MISVAPALPNNFVTVPTGVRIVLRDIDAHEESGVAGTVMALQSPAGGNLWVAQRVLASDSGNAQWRGRQVFNPGESFNFHVFSGTWSLQASGYELTLT